MFDLCLIKHVLTVWPLTSTFACFDNVWWCLVVKHFPFVQGFRATTFIFFLLHIIFTKHNDVCGNSPKISEDFPKFDRRPDERFQIFSEDFRTFTLDNRRLLKTSKEDQRMSRSYTDKFKCCKRAKKCYDIFYITNEHYSLLTEWEDKMIY